MAPRALRRCLVLLALLELSPAAAADSPPCLGDALAPHGAAALVRDAVRVLAACGHDPAGYRVTLTADEFVEPGVTSVVFIPRDAREGYALRVSRRDPCHVAWVASAPLTPWQRRVVDTARAWTTRRWPDVAPTQIEVLEERARLELRLLRHDGRGGTSLLGRILMEKDELHVVRGARNEAAPKIP